MSEQDRYIPGVPCWVDTTQPDPDAGVAFYGKLFGWELEDVMPPDAPGRYFTARLGGGDVAAVSSPMGDAPPVAMWNTYIWVDDADETAAKVRAAGGTVLSEPFDVMEAGRMGVFADREGAVFCAWQAAKHRGATVVNEPGSLNFNVLNTRDLEGAQAFYGAVFGWELLPMGMWALPAYGDHLEALNPGTRERTAEMGGPERFEEVVASFTVIPDDQPDTPAHWDVTFGVANADAIATRAADLGGTVLVPPFDAPWIRGTVIRDPQGATFNANQFVPPENQDAASQEADAAVGGT
jgi:predicted enzyme related to lactoylglutathione lyase